MKKVLLSVFFCFVLTVSVQAQPYIDLFRTKYQYFPAANFSDDSKSKVSGTQWTTSLFLPIETKKKNAIIIAAEYSLLGFSVTGDTSFTSKLSSKIALLGYNKKWKNEKWKTLFMAQMKVNTHSIKVRSGDYQFGGVVLFDYKRKSNLNYHFGLYYNREYFGNFFVPLLGIDWRIDSTLSLFGDIPNKMSLEKKFSRKFYAGISYTSCTATYRADDALTPDDYIREGDKFWSHNEIKVYANIYLTKHVVVFVEAGRTLGRMFEVYRDKEVLAIPRIAFRKSEDSFLVNGGLAYRFRLD